MSETDLDSQLVADITESLANGNKIEAIKTYRMATGQRLKESKEFIDQLIPGLVEKDPQRFAAISNGSGCGTAILFVAAFVAASGFALMVGFQAIAG